jgi:hypothetical protein
MRTIRRSLGAFTVAVVMAAGLLTVPAHAEGRGNGNKTDFCEALAASIEAVNALPDSPLKSVLLAYLDVLDKTYCSE